MKKFILLITCILFLSGCSVKYTLDISKDEITENITLISENISDSERIYNYSFPTPAYNNAPVMSESYEKLAGVEYYDTNKTLESNGYYNYHLKYQFPFTKFNESNIISNSVAVFNVYKKSQTYYIETGANIKSFDQMNGISNLQVVVNLSYDLELVSSNADTVVGNTLTWNISNSDSKTRPISIAYKEKTDDNNNGNNNNSNSNNTNQNNIQEENDNYSLIVALIGLIIFGITLVMIITFKNKSRK